METKNKDLTILPILPLKSAVLFPNMLVPLAVGRPRSVAALDAAISSEGKEILLAAQKDTSIENPGIGDLFSTQWAPRQSSKNCAFEK